MISYLGDMGFVRGTFTATGFVPSPTVRTAAPEPVPGFSFEESFAPAPVSSADAIARDAAAAKATADAAKAAADAAAAKAAADAAAAKALAAKTPAPTVRTVVVSAAPVSSSPLGVPWIAWIGIAAIGGIFVAKKVL